MIKIKSNIVMFISSRKRKLVSYLKNTKIKNILEDKIHKNTIILEKEYDIVSDIPFSKVINMRGTITSVTKYNPTIVID
jgi:hypothetical protein